MTKTESYSKPVSETTAPTADMLSSAHRVTHEGPNTLTGEDHGIIAHRADGSHTIHFCDTAKFRDDTVIPFFTFYNNVVRVERF